MAYQLLEPMNALFLLIMSMVALAGGYSVMTPLHSRRKPALRWQCRLPDVMVLLTQLAAAGALVFRRDEEISLAEEIGGLAFLWALMTLWWWLGVRTLSRKAIDDPLRRFVVLALLCPVIYGWPLVVLMGNPIFLIFFANILLLIPLLLLLLLYKVTRRIADWVAQPVNPAAATAPRGLAPLRWIAGLVLCVVMTTAVTIPLWTGYTVGPIFYKTALHRFRTEMRLRADVPAMQNWLAHADVETLKKSIELKPAELPSCVTRLTDRACVTDEGTLVLIWGNGFGHWGLTIAPPGTPLPGEDSREYHLPLADGAWVWHEIQ